jgi:Big-like domain-containing protein
MKLARFSSRRLTIAVATVASAIATVAGATTATAAVQQFASAAPAAATPATVHKLLKRAQRAWIPGQGLRRGELTPLLRQLALQLPHLRGSERRQAEALLARPTDREADPQQDGYTVDEAPASPACNDHYCVHWVAITDDAPPTTDSNSDGIPDYVDSVLATTATVHAVEHSQLGWRLPKGDGTAGGGTGVDKTDIYLKQLGPSGIYGYSAIDPDQAPLTETDHSQSGYVVIDNDFQKSEFRSYDSPLTPLQVTVAHEYNHIIQFAYDALQDTWMLESSAVWMEGAVYPEAHDYLQYLPGWVHNTRVPLTSFNGSDPSDPRNVKVYGSAVWEKWLEGRYGPAVVRGAWEDSLSTSPVSFAPAAFDSSIRKRGGASLQDEFDRFATATAEWGAQNSGFPEGGVYPDVQRVGTFAVNGPGLTTKLDHTAYALRDVPIGTASRIKLATSAPPGTASAVALVGLTPASTATIALHEMPKGGIGSATLENPSQFTRITAVLVNSDTRVDGFAPEFGDWSFVRDDQPFYARVSTDFTAPRVVRVAPAAGASRVGRGVRAKVTFSEPVRGVDKTSLQLLAPNGRAVGSSVKLGNGSRVATIVPSRLLAGARPYRVRVRATITDASLNRLVRPVSSRFRTR